MKFKLLNVVWHDKDPVFSIDWHPSGRIATGGSDKEVKIWRIENINSPKPTVKFVCSLVRHMNNVNAVRFSPNGRFLASCSDDGFICIWELQKQSSNDGSKKETKEKDDKENGKSAAAGDNEKEEEKEEEIWTVYKSIKAPARDVCDIAWSACSRFIVGGTSENTSFVGSARSGSVLSVAREHSNSIQGVSWDPLNKYVVTQSSDQTVRVYTTTKGNSGKMIIKCVIRDLRLPESNPNSNHKRNSHENVSSSSEPLKKKCKALSDEIVCPKKESAKINETDATNNEKVNKGEEKVDKEEEENEVVKVEEEDENEDDEDDEEDAIEEAKSSARPKMFLSEVANTFFRRNSWSPDGSLLILPSGIFRTQIAPSTSSNDTPTGNVSVKVSNTAYVFSRGDFRRPVCHFPGHEKVVVATKFCPVLFKLKTKSPVIPLPYRMVVAVATADSVILYDTETAHALGAANKVHYSQITDLAWIEEDGMLHLIVSSRDGFCSLLSFEKDELGERLDKKEYPEVMGKIEEIRNTPFKAQQAKEVSGEKTESAPANSSVKNAEEKPLRKRIKPMLISQNP